MCFCFADEKKARDVYDSIKAWTCKLGRIEKLYAFSYQPQVPEKEFDGWEIYNASREWRRLGINDKGLDKGWRISKINADYGVGSIVLKGIKAADHYTSSSHLHILLYCQYHQRSPIIPSTTQVGIAHACAYLS